jgi:hypothetical protein
MRDGVLTISEPSDSVVRAALLASVLGLALGAAWMLSPLTVVIGGLTVWMCARRVSTLNGSERVQVAWILGVAVAARFLVVGAMLLATRPEREPFFSVFPDARYVLDRSIWIRNLWLGVDIGPHQWLGIFVPYAASSFPYVLAAIQTVVGPAPYGVCLLSVVLFIAGALLIHSMIREAFGAACATFALGSILFWPTLFAWSVSVLRESSQWFLVALSTAALFHLVRDRRLPARVGWTAALVGALAALSTLRSGILEIALVGIALALAFRAVSARASIAVALLAIGALGFWRAEDRIVSTVRLAADRHLGHVMSAGSSYRLLDEKYYAAGSGSLAAMTIGDSVRYLASSAAAFVVVPAPWRIGSAMELGMVPQQLAWYGALAAAFVGVVVGLRRDAWLTCILSAYPVAGMIVIAPNSGNIGTLVRHRDMIVPFVLSLAAIGIVALVNGTGRTAR